MNIIIYASNDERVNKVAIRVGINERISKQDKGDFVVCARKAVKRKPYRFFLSVI